jgi:hypothetical protein
MRPRHLLPILLLAACHPRDSYPPGGYPYPEHVADKDTNFYYYPVKDKMPRRDSFRHSGDYLLFQVYNEPNLSLKPSPSPLFRFFYSGYTQGSLIIVLSQNSLIVKRHKEVVPDPAGTDYITFKRSVTPAEYQYFVDLLNASNYWQMPCVYTCTQSIADGAYFSLEANTPEKYNFVSGPSCPADSGKYYQACQTLIRYAKLDEHIHLIWDSKLDSTTRTPLVVEDVQLEDIKIVKKSHRKK